MGRLSSKNQITIPVKVLREAGIRPGDEVIVRTGGQGKIEVERVQNFVDRYAGSMPPGTYPPGYLDKLRDEWDR